MILLIGSLWSDGISNAAYGQTYGKLTGRVVDAETGDLLPSVNIILDNSIPGSSTNFKGEYFVLGVPVGLHELSASFIGYTTVKVTNIWISAGLATSVDIELNQTTLELGNEVVVTAQRSGIGKYASGTNHVLLEDEILNSFGETPTEIIATIPGIGRDNTIRGGRPSDIDFQIDGISTRDALFGGLSYESFLNNLSLKEIQVKTGGFNAEYGNVMSGVVNLITKEGGDTWTGDIRLKNSISALNGENGDFKLNPRGEKIVEFAAGGPVLIFNKDISLFFSGKFNAQSNRTPGLDVRDPAGNNITDYQHNRLAQYGFFGKAVHQINPNMKITAAGLFGRLNQEEDSWLWRYNSSINALPSFIRQNAFGYIRFTYSLSQHLFYEATVEMLDSQTERGLANESGESFWFFDYDVQPILNKDVPFEIGADNPYGVNNVFISNGQLDSYWATRSQYFGAELKVVSQLKDYLQFRAGIESKLYKAKGRFTSSSVVSAAKELDAYENEPYDISAYTGSSINIGRFFVDTGIRLHYFDPQTDRSLSSPHNLIQIGNQKLRLSPRAGISYEFQNNLIAHANFGWHYQLPSFHGLYSRNSQNLLRPATESLTGNPTLDPQRSIVYEAGLHYSVSDQIQISAAGFYKALQQIEVADMTSNSTNVTPQYDDIGVGKTMGLEFNFVKNLGQHFGMRASYTISSARGSYMYISPFQVEGNLLGTLNDLNGILTTPQLLQTASEQEFFPLPFDRRHSFRAVFNYVIPKNSGPSLFGMKPLQNVTANLTGFAESGTPYTTTALAGLLNSGINTNRNPWYFNTNIRLQKYIANRFSNFTFFLDIKNLINRVEPVAKYSRTGSPLYSAENIDSRTIWTENGETPPESLYNRVADLNNDGVLDESEQEAAYNNFLSDSIKLKSLFQLPREVWTGLQFHF